MRRLVGAWAAGLQEVGSCGCELGGQRKVAVQRWSVVKCEGLVRGLGLQVVECSVDGWVL